MPDALMRWCAVVALLLLLSVTRSFADAPRPFPDPPDWVHDKVTYEVNLRQFSPTGDVAGFRPHLQRLKDMGVGVLWFMPVHPIGVEGRSGTLGSYYAVRDYTAFNPEFGTLDAFKALVNEAHDLGMHVILDWVANHTALDHAWTQEHPDWYTRGPGGELVPPVEAWADVADLNFESAALREAMIDAMAFWVREVGVDGFRCDTAEWVPLDFWCDARDALYRIKPVFLLAEGNKAELVDDAFDAVYAWDLTPNMEQIAAGAKRVTDLANYLNADARVLTGDGFRLNFTSNHDKNSWEGPATQRMGPGLAAFTVLTFTVRGMPLIYTGQEAGLDRALAFFDRDPFTWRADPMARIYTDLATLKAQHPALWHGGHGAPLRILTATDAGLLVFIRAVAGDTVIVALNLSPDAQPLALPREASHLPVVLTSEGIRADGDQLTLPPWSYRVWASAAQ